MASIIVDGPAGITGQAAVRRIAERLREEGHLVEKLEGALLDALRSSDAVVAVLDGDSAQVLGTLTAAAAMEKPVLALVGPGSGPALDLPHVTYRTGTSEADWLTALPEWTASLKPFSGRLVRDLIPRLVEEAGHEVSFRSVDKDDRPRFLKQKVLQEAKELAMAKAGAEKEEIGDLLEALEALIRERGYERDALKQIKDAKRKQRGGFERCWVVESTASKEDPGPSHDDRGNLVEV